MKNCPQQYPIDFAIRWACKRNRENSHLSAYQHRHSVNHRTMICVLLMVVFFIVCTTIDREVRILERPLSRTIKNELRFFAFVRSGYTMQEVVDQLSEDYGWSDSVSNLSNKLQRESLRYVEAVQLADALGYELVWQKRRDK